MCMCMLYEREALFFLDCLCFLGVCVRVVCMRVSACVRAHVRVRACEYARGRWRAHALACERACACVYECLLTP